VLRKNFLIILLAFVFFGVSSLENAEGPNAGASAIGRMRVKVRLSESRQNFAKEEESFDSLRQWLARNSYDIAGIDYSAHTIEVITNNGGIQELKAHGWKVDIEASATSTVDNRYLNHQSLEAKLKGLVQTYPKLAHLEMIGQSFEGLMISNNPDPSDSTHRGKANLLVDGVHHAREVMTAEVVADMGEVILQELQNKNPFYEDIIQRWNIWLVPMLNVDGSNIVFTKDNFWRKNARAKENSTFGVDINRNYDFNWSNCSGSNALRTAQDYHGEGPASEPETQALQNLADQIRPSAYLSYHSFSELVLYAYGCKSKKTADSAWVETVAQELSQNLPTDDGKGFYKIGRPWEILYAVDGDSMGYMVGKFGALGVTFEINQAFQPDYALRDPTLKKHRVAWQTFLQRIDEQLLRVQVIDGKTGWTANAQLEISFPGTDLDAYPMATNSGGYYSRVLAPGNYQIRAKLRDGRFKDVNFQKSQKAQDLKIQVDAI
jgi:murein tripeptide amidase MpaA